MDEKTGQEKKIWWRSSWVEIETWSLLSSYHHGQDKLRLGNLNIISRQIKIKENGEKTSKLKTFSLHFPLPLARLNWSIPDSSTSSTPTSSAGGWGNESYDLSAVVPSCYSLLLIPFPCFTMILSPGFKGISAPATGACNPSHSLLLLTSAWLFLTWISYAFSQLLHSIFILSIICYHRGTAKITDGLNFGNQWAHFGVNWNWLCSTQGQLLIFFHKGYTRSLFLPCYEHPVQFWLLNDLFWETQSLNLNCFGILMTKPSFHGESAVFQNGKAKC